jgi:hypothetical protein
VIQGTAAAGVYLSAGGSVNNTGTISGGYAGVSIYGAAGTVTNAGTIESTYAAGGNGTPTGVFLEDGGSVTNASAGLISGAQYGIDLNGVSGGVDIVTNAGTIESTSGIAVEIVGGAQNTLTNSGTISRGAIPAELELQSTDTRRLGTCIERIVLRDDHLRLDVSNAHPALCDGLHENEGAHRWTDGMARLPEAFLAPFAGSFTIEVRRLQTGRPQSGAALC